MTQPTQTTGQIVDDFRDRLDAAQDLARQHPAGRYLADLLVELKGEISSGDPTIFPAAEAVAHLLMDPPAGSVTVVAGDESDIRRLAVAVFGGADPIPTQLAKARRWLAALAENGARHA